MAEILKGAPVAAALTEESARRSEELKKRGITPTLAIVRVGENESDLAYERGALKRAEKTGIEVVSFILPETSTTEDLLRVIGQINSDDAIHGCLMFRPLPHSIDEAAVCEALDPVKDVDCMTSGSLARVFTGKGRGYAPCTAQSCIEILKHYGYDPAGRDVTVVGRSLVIGKPVSMMLQAMNATVTMCHTKTVNIAEKCAGAEILVVAAGRAGVVGVAHTNPDQVIIDVGINVDQDGQLCGDVSYAEVEPEVAAITPVPGGVGAVTTAVLCRHVIEAAEQKAVK